jgi:hypothetical protein
MKLILHNEIPNFEAAFCAIPDKNVLRRNYK